MTVGRRWNGYFAVNDQRGLYTWTIAGSNFGNTRGQVRLAGRDVPILAWSNTQIRIDPSGAQINPSTPWNWQPMSATLVVRTSTGQEASRSVDIVPAIRSRIYEQCTWHVARRRIEMGLQPSPTAYGQYTAFSASWVPRAGDQLKWGGTPAAGGVHQAIIERVSGPVISGKVKTYTITLSQYNAGGHNEFNTFTTTFQVTGQTVTQLPKFRTGGVNATGYYR
jgi:surface antigen